MTGSLTRFLRPALGWAAWLALLGLAWNLKHPMMLWLRTWETPLLLFTGMAGSSYAALRPLPSDQSRAGRRLFAGALLAVAALAIYRELEFQRDRDEVLAASADMRSVGAHFIVGFKDFAAVEPLAARGLISGIYLTRRNLKNASVADIASRIDHLQAVRRQAGLPPLVVAADQEGGPVSHLSPLLAAMPPLASLVGPDAPAVIASRARHYGAEQGAGLAALGVNLNFGPVVDLRPTQGGFAGDRIASRAIAADPAVVTAVGRGYVEGLAEAGVGATLKHFPGLGRVRADTHFTRASLAASAEELAGDWQPFREIGRSTEAAMMVGHVVLASVDNRRAASHSAAVVQGLLRDQWHYRGILITDDLNMGAVYGEGIGKVAGEALAAGIDMVLVAYDPDQYFRAMQGAAGALRRGAIDREVLAASDRRLRQFHDGRRPGSES